MTNTLYKLAPARIWSDAVKAGVFKGAAIDLADGFIHFSTAGQVRETAARHFATADDLVLVAVNGAMLGDRLRWEPSRGGDLFPHLYDMLRMNAVMWTVPLPRGPDGHQFPANLA